MYLHPFSESMGVELGGILGMPVLWHLKLTIDYPSGSVKPEYSPSIRR